MNFYNELDKNDILEDDIILHSLNALRNMEIIDMKDGVKLGFVKDIVIDIDESKIKSIIIPFVGKGWFGKEEVIEIPWENVKKVGADVIIVDTTNMENYF